MRIRKPLWWLAFRDVSRSSLASGAIPLVLLGTIGCMAGTAQFLHQLPVSPSMAFLFASMGLGPVLAIVLPLSCLLAVSTASFLLQERGGLAALSHSGVPRHALLSLPVWAGLLLAAPCTALSHWLAPFAQAALHDAILAVEPDIGPGGTERFGPYTLHAAEKDGEDYLGLAVAGPDFVGFAARGRFTDEGLELEGGLLRYLPSSSLRVDFQRASFSLERKESSPHPTRLTTGALLQQVERRRTRGLDCSFERKELYKRSTVPASLLPLSVAAFVLGGLGLRPSAVSMGIAFAFWAAVRFFDAKLVALGPWACALAPLVLASAAALICSRLWAER